MKKVVRLSESDLTSLVKKIINEAPFDSERFGTLSPEQMDKMSDEDWRSRREELHKALADYDEFEKSDLRELLSDTEKLLSIAKDYCKNYLYDDQPHQYCRFIPRIEERIEKFHSNKFSKRGFVFPEQPINPYLVARRKPQ
jgi:iron uptake system EfeUOB component EfeO/EfeM